MSDEMNKLDLLIKVMRMTEGDNENQSLVAIRKANALLKAEGWDWDRLLRGKVKVIADPFGAVSAPAPQAKAAKIYQPYSPPPVTPRPVQPAPDPWAGIGRPATPKPCPASPPPPPGPPVAKQMPLHFRKSTSGEWCIASYMRADAMVGQSVQLEKRDGTKRNEICGPFVEQCQTSGYYLYKIAKATKWGRKFADQSSINDLL